MPKATKAAPSADTPPLPASFVEAAERIQRITEAALPAARQLSQATDETAVPTLPLSSLCRVYDRVRGLHEALEEAERVLSKLKQHLAVTIMPARFQDDGTSSLTVGDLGARFTVNTRFNVSMVDKRAAVEWLRAEGYGALVQETVNSSTLASFAREYVEQQGNDLPATHFRVGLLQHISRTKV